MPAPAPFHSACLTVIERALLEARSWGDARAVPAEHLADLMDAIHNLPYLLQDWGRCDVELLRAMLKTYEDKWRGQGGLALLALFDQAVAQADSPPRC